MSNIDTYAQFITKQKEKNDFGYPSKIEEADGHQLYDGIGNSLKNYEDLHVVVKKHGWPERNGRKDHKIVSATNNEDQANKWAKKSGGEVVHGSKLADWENENR